LKSSRFGNGSWKFNKIKIKTNFCRANTKDGLRLDGLLFAPEGEARAAVLHISGRAGNFYLPARIPRGFAPGMNGGESNFSDRGAFSEASEYLEALPRGSLCQRVFGRNG